MPNENSSVVDIFCTALEITSDEDRSRFLDQACAGSTDLRHRVDELLKAYTSASDFMEQPPELLGSQSDSELPATPGSEPTQPPKQLVRDVALNWSTGALPRHFGDYELLEQIAHGGMGIVYRARQKSLNRIVAIKMILAGQFAGPDEIKRFYIEAEAAAHLDHPGIVPVFEVGAHEGQHYFSMGFVHGESLANKLKAGPVPPRVAAMYVRKIAAAVHVAHEQGIVHRDLKPGNVLLDKQGEPKVTDFGLAKRVEANSELTATGMVIGTPSYMPPEQAAGKLDQINASADIYSLGAILYALLTARPPFEAETQVETLMHVLHEEPVTPRKLAGGVPKDLEAICLKCLEKKAGNRYRSAADLENELQLFLAGEPVSARNDWLRRIRKWSKREPVLATHLVAIAVMMAIIFSNYWLFGRNETQSRNVLLINELILLIWALAAFVLQKTHNILRSKTLIPLIWAAVNPLFLTMALVANQPPRGALMSLYLLLMVTTAFFRRVELVAIATLSSLVGFIALLVAAPDPAFPPSYKVLFAATLVVAGVLLGFQVRRVNRLSQKDSV